MKHNHYLSSWIKRFLMEYLEHEMNFSKNTQKSYRDTFRLLVPFLSAKSKVPIDKLLLTHMNDNMIKFFLLDLETNRHCSSSTRNQRLAAIHAFAKFVGLNNPESLEWCRQIRVIPFKKTQQNLLTYLEKHEMDSLLDTPDQRTKQGQRDYALLLFLYNTGVRADEAAQLTIADLHIAHAPKRDFSEVTIRGKGNKLRRCLLWQKTIDELSGLVMNRNSTEHVFLNCCQQPLTRFGIHTMVKRYVKKIAHQVPSIQKKRVSPHTIRYTTATHLLHASVDINTIRAWLGHVSINTTNIYAEVDIAMKAKALACCEIKGDKSPLRWRDNEDLMKFLDAI